MLRHALAPVPSGRTRLLRVVQDLQSDPLKVTSEGCERGILCRSTRPSRPGSPGRDGFTPDSGLPLTATDHDGIQQQRGHRPMDDDPRLRATSNGGPEQTPAPLLDSATRPTRSLVPVLDAAYWQLGTRCCCWCCLGSCCCGSTRGSCWSCCSSSRHGRRGLSHVETVPTGTLPHVSTRSGQRAARPGYLPQLKRQESAEDTDLHAAEPAGPSLGWSRTAHGRSRRQRAASRRTRPLDGPAGRPLPR